MLREEKRRGGEEKLLENCFKKEKRKKKIFFQTHVWKTTFKIYELYAKKDTVAFQKKAIKYWTIELLMYWLQSSFKCTLKIWIICSFFPKLLEDLHQINCLFQSFLYGIGMVIFNQRAYLTSSHLGHEQIFAKCNFGWIWHNFYSWRETYGNCWNTYWNWSWPSYWNDKRS